MPHLAVRTAVTSGSLALTGGIKERHCPWSSPGGNSAVAKIHMPKDPRKDYSRLPSNSTMENLF